MYTYNTYNTEHSSSSLCALMLSICGHGSPPLKISRVSDYICILDFIKSCRQTIDVFLLVFLLAFYYQIYFLFTKFLCVFLFMKYQTKLFFWFFFCGKRGDYCPLNDEPLFSDENKGPSTG